MYYIKQGIRKAWVTTKVKPGFVVGAIAVQMVVAIVCIALLFYFQVKILNQVQALLTIINRATADPALLQAGQPFLQDFGSVLTIYQTILQTIILMIISVFAALLIGNSLLWSLAHKTLQSTTNIKNQMLHYAVAMSTLYVPFILVTWGLGQKFLQFTTPVTVVNRWIVVLAVLDIILYYFLMSAAAQTSPNWKQFLKDTITTAIKRAPRTVVTFILTLLPVILCIAALGATLYYTELFWLAVVLIILTITTIVFSRLFWIATHETNHS